MSEFVFQQVGNTIAQRKSGRFSASDRMFCSLFGCTAKVCSSLWNQLNGVHPENSRYEYLMYALLFLKVYATEHVNSALTGVSEKTFRKWSWKYVELLSGLENVSLN